MSTRAALKAAKSAWDAQNFSEVVKQAKEVLSLETHNYLGCVERMQLSVSPFH